MDADEKCRRSFEAWAVETYDVIAAKDDNGEYTYRCLQRQWNAWQHQQAKLDKALEIIGEAYMEGYSDGLGKAACEFEDYIDDAAKDWIISSARQALASLEVDNE